MRTDRTDRTNGAITDGCRGGQLGQAMLEFVFATLLALVIILGIIQIALVFNAHHMVQLAAFNAARAAIVTRNPNANQPGEATTLQEMQRKAQLAAFITLLPVIPDLHGALPASLAGSPSAIRNLFNLNAANPTAGGGLAAFGQKAAGVLLEYTMINVKFVKANQDDDAPAMSPSDISAMDPARNRVEFDDHNQPADNNLIKVIVSWNYPLVIPFANRIFFAAINLGFGGSYPLAYLAAHPSIVQQNPLLAARIVAGDRTVLPPVWGLGLEYEILINKGSGALSELLPSVPGGVQGFVGDLARRLLYRVPVKASYIMRMQWDRKP
jgi:hypothetical protein